MSFTNTHNTCHSILGTQLLVSSTWHLELATCQLIKLALALKICATFALNLSHVNPLCLCVCGVIRSIIFFVRSVYLVRCSIESIDSVVLLQHYFPFCFGTIPFRSLSPLCVFHAFLCHCVRLYIYNKCAAKMRPCALYITPFPIHVYLYVFQFADEKPAAMQHANGSITLDEDIKSNSRHSHIPMKSKHILLIFMLVSVIKYVYR